jgi:hypothetical protein
MPPVCRHGLGFLGLNGSFRAENWSLIGQLRPVAYLVESYQRRQSRVELS